MAPHEDGENNFSDDDFLNDLPEDALDELENNAIASTQARLKPPPSSDYGEDFDDDDLDDAVVIDEARSVPAVVPYLHKNNVNQTSRQDQFHHQHYGNRATVNRPRNNYSPPLVRQADHLQQPYSASISREVSNLSRQNSQSFADCDNEVLRKLVQEVFSTVSLMEK